MKMRVLGMISGTSFDAIELAVADLKLVGRTLELTPVGATSVDFSAELRREIATILPPAATSIEAVARLDAELGRAFAGAACNAISSLCDESVDLIASHGQTVFHWVEDGRARGTLQLGNPSWIAQRTGVPVVSDLRNRDVAAGGQGAPLVAMLDELLVLQGNPRRGSLNLGGIANITVTDSSQVIAYDVGPANALMDAAVSEQTGGAETFDTDGARARRGTVRSDLLNRLLSEPYYAAEPPKSTGKELFDGGYTRRMCQGLPPVAPDDLLATLAELTARTISDAQRRHELTELVVAGGGSRNPLVMRRIAELTPGCSVRTIDDFGVPPTAKEAYLIALLGYFTAHGLPGTLSGATGAASGSVLGSITPGAQGWPLPREVPQLPQRIVVTDHDH